MAKREYFRDGLVQWLNDKGHVHREDGPAEVWNDGEQYWYRHGRSHFAHGPADLWADGRMAWFEDSKLLRMRREPYG